MSHYHSVKTTCPYCGVGCGVKLAVEGPEKITVEGDSDHPANFGRLCSKGLSLAETVDLEGRLLQPQINGETASWPQAIKTVADSFNSIIQQHGSDAVAFYVSGQLLTEDYYVANKLMKACIGSANIDTNSRLCMSSAVVGHKRAFGMDSVPCNYEDLEKTDLLVITGSNTAWCHPVLFQRIRAAKEARENTASPMTVVIVDPRRTSTCDIADLHLALKPGSDVALFNGLFSYLVQQGHLDNEYIEEHTEGFFDVLRSVGKTSLTLVSEQCGLAVDKVIEFFDLFARHERTVSFYSQGVNQSSSGSDKANSIINLHLATGRIGKEGTGPFSITGQPNAMGGREVGGLANQLAAHMDFSNAEHVELVEEFWQAPNMARENGLKALDMFEAVESGKIKAIWIMATNPVVSLPDADRWKQALQACDMVVVSDCNEHTDTTACANVLLPATTWGEKSGTVTNSERRISRQRAFRNAPGQAKADWWAVSEVAKAMGFARQFSYDNEADIFREHAALSGYKNSATTQRDFDISELKNITQQDYDDLQPIQWPIQQGQGTPRLYADSLFYTPSGKAQILRVEHKAPVNSPSKEYPLVLNTGRIRDQWHTMTRTAKSSRLLAHLAEPFVQVHRDDASRYTVQHGDLAKVSSEWGQALARVEVTEDQQQGSVFVPIHWNEQFASLSRIGAVVNPVADPHSGQPEFKHTPVSLSAYDAKWQGFILSREALAFDAEGYCVKAKGEQFWRYELAGNEAIADYSAWADGLLGDAPRLDYSDTAQGQYRSALIENNRLQAVICVSPSYELPARAWLSQLFAQEELSADARLALLAGRPADVSDDAGKTICSCYAVGINTITTTVQELLDKQGECSVTAVGACVKAGTNCGSCVPELRAIIAEQAARARRDVA